jgi:hypothetical protein
MMSAATSRLIPIHFKRQISQESYLERASHHPHQETELIFFPAKNVSPIG